MDEKLKAAPAGQQQSFLGSADGVTVVAVDGGGYAVEFGFDRQLNAIMRAVPGAEMDKGSAGRVFMVPEASAEALGKAIGSMRVAAHFIAESRDHITTLATARGHDVQRANGADHTVRAQVSEYIDTGKFYAGEILAVNGHYAAQLTGFGKEDGAAFVAIHRLANLDNAEVVKGDHVGVKYDEKYRGVVTDLSKTKSAAELEADFVAQAGKTIDGIAVSETKGGIGVSFELNPLLLARIKRVDGAEFKRADGVWEIPLANKSFALRAAHDMRIEFVEDAKEVEALRGVAESKVDGANVQRAFMKDGWEHFGNVIAVGERYVLQKGGQGRFALHHLASLDHKPEVGQSLSIKYNKGVGTVVDQEQKRAQEKALGVAR